MTKDIQPFPDELLCFAMAGLMNHATSIPTSKAMPTLLKYYAKSNSRLGEMVGMSAGDAGTELGCAGCIKL